LGKFSPQKLRIVKTKSGNEKRRRRKALLMCFPCMMNLRAIAFAQIAFIGSESAIALQLK
jgi:hypothetical protein